MFPIISSVYFDKELKNKCQKIGILPIRIIRTNFQKVMKKSIIYKKRVNVVGKDINYENFYTKVITNNNTNDPIKNIIKLF